MDEQRATIFVADGATRDWGPVTEPRERKLREVSAYLYSGWEYKGWGSDPDAKSPQTGFLFEGPDGGGFGADALLARLASGLHFGHREDGPAVTLGYGPDDAYQDDIDGTTPDDGIGIAPSMRILDSEVIAKTPAEAMRIVRRAATDRGFTVVDVVQRPYPIGRGTWRIELAVVAVNGR